MTVIIMFLNIHSCIQCETLTHIWHINISSSIMRLSITHDRKMRIRGYPPEPTPIQQVFPALARFGFLKFHNTGRDE